MLLHNPEAELIKKRPIYSENFTDVYEREYKYHMGRVKIAKAEYVAARAQVKNLISEFYAIPKDAGEEIFADVKHKLSNARWGACIAKGKFIGTEIDAVIMQHLWEERKNEQAD